MKKINPWDALCAFFLLVTLVCILSSCKRPVALIFNDPGDEVRCFTDGEQSGTQFHVGQLGWTNE